MRDLSRSIVVAWAWGVGYLLIQLRPNDETFRFVLRRLVLAWARQLGRLVGAENVISYFLGANSNIRSLIVAHIVQGLLILAGTWV